MRAAAGFHRHRIGAGLDVEIDADQGAPRALAVGIRGDVVIEGADADGVGRARPARSTARRARPAAATATAPMIVIGAGAGSSVVRGGGDRTRII